MSISASWLVLAVLLLRLVLKKAPKWVSVLLWGFVAVRLICPFTVESMLSLIPSAETISPGIMMDWTPEISTGIASLDTVVNPIITESFAPKPYASANPLQILIPVSANLWILGIFIMLVYTAVSYILLRHKVATAVLLRGNIYQSENVVSPFVLGLFRPKIYLPFQMDLQNLEHVIAHEESHIQRKDHWWKPLGFILLALHWFNPLLWLGYILLCRDIELACDEKVIKEMDCETKADYSQALVACSVNRRRIAACPLAFGEVGVKERVKSVMNYKKPAFWVIVVTAVVCTAVAVCFLTNPMHGVNLPELRMDEANMPGILNNVTEMVVTYDGVSVSCTEKAQTDRFLATLEKIQVKEDPISRNRSWGRSKAFSIKVNGGTELNFNESFTRIWVDDHVKPSLTHRITNPKAAKALLEDFKFAVSSVDSTVGTTNDSQYSFLAKVLEVQSQYLLVEPLLGSAERNTAEKIALSLKEKESWPIPQVGDMICVLYTGEIEGENPARITKVNRVEIIDYGSYPAKTDDGLFKPHFKSTNGTWQAEGRSYRYRHEITGRMHTASADTTFVYLSNLETITFEQAWKAAGYSSNTADYFSPEEAMLVEIRHDTSTVGVLTSDRLIAIAANGLDTAVSIAILELNRDDSYPNKPSGMLHEESHYVLSVETKSANPLLGLTGQQEEITVYVLYAYNRYYFSGGAPEVRNSVCKPAAIKFLKTQGSGYALQEFWEPNVGSAYEKEIRDKFPEDIANLVLDPEGNKIDTNALDVRCLEKAKEYISSLSK